MGRARQGQVTAGRQQDERDHAVGVGAEPAEESQVLDQDPVGQAQHGEPGQCGADQPRPAADERDGDHSERDHHEQVHREAVRLVESGEGGHPPGQEAGSGGR